LHCRLETARGLLAGISSRPAAEDMFSLPISPDIQVLQYTSQAKKRTSKSPQERKGSSTLVCPVPRLQEDLLHATGLSGQQNAFFGVPLARSSGSTAISIPALPV
jgi:hypothetical protein